MLTITNKESPDSNQTVNKGIMKLKETKKPKKVDQPKMKVISEKKKESKEWRKIAMRLTPTR